MILRPLDFSKPDQLMYLTTDFPALGLTRNPLSVQEYLEFRIARVIGRDECRDDTERDAGDDGGDERKCHDREINRHLIEPRNRNPIADQREQAG